MPRAQRVERLVTIAVVLVPDVFAELHPEPDDAALGRDVVGDHPVGDAGVGLAGDLAQRVEVPIVVEEPVVRVKRLRMHAMWKARGQSRSLDEASVVTYPCRVELPDPAVLPDDIAIDHDVAEHDGDPAACIADRGAPALVVLDECIDLPRIAQDVARDAHFRERDHRGLRLACALDEPEHGLDIEIGPPRAHLHLRERDDRKVGGHGGAPNHRRRRRIPPPRARNLGVRDAARGLSRRGVRWPGPAGAGCREGRASSGSVPSRSGRRNRNAAGFRASCRERSNDAGYTAGTGRKVYGTEMNEVTGRSKAASMLLTAAAFVVVVAGMRAAESIVVPFLLSVFIAIICAPSLFWLERKGLPRWLAMLLVIGAIIAVGIGVTALVGTSIREFSRDLPEYRARINAQVVPVVEWLRAKGMSIPTGEYMSYFEPGAAVQLVADLLNGFGRVLGNTFLIFLTVVFILFETSSFPRKFQAVADDPDHALDRFAVFRENVKRYLVIKTAASLGTGAVIGLWLAVLGVDYPVLWGLLAFLLNYVPNIGSIIAAVPAVLFATVQLGPGAALWSAAGYLVVNVVVGSIIEPRFMGRGLGLSALVVFLSLVFWGWVLGPVGMFLSVPLTMMIKIALDSRPDTHWIAVLLGPEGAAAEELAARVPEPESRCEHHEDNHPA